MKQEDEETIREFIKKESKRLKEFLKKECKCELCFKRHFNLQ